MNVTDPIYSDPDLAREHLESILWPEGPVCPHCGSVEGLAKLQGVKHRAGLYYCNACKGQFTVTVGTVLERSKIPLNKWVLAFHLYAASKKGMSAHQLHRMLGITYKSAWFMAHRIREAMRELPTDSVDKSVDNPAASGLPPQKPARRLGSACFLGRSAKSLKSWCYSPALCDGSLTLLQTSA